MVPFNTLYVTSTIQHVLKVRSQSISKYSMYGTISERALHYVQCTRGTGEALCTQRALQTGCNPATYVNHLLVMSHTIIHNTNLY